MFSLLADPVDSFDRHCIDTCDRQRKEQEPRMAQGTSDEKAGPRG